MSWKSKNWFRINLWMNNSLRLIKGSWEHSAWNIVYECLNGWIVAWTEGLPCTVVQVSYCTPRHAIQTVAVMFSLCAHVPRISHVTSFNPPNTPPFKWCFLRYADMDLGTQCGCYLPRFTEGVSGSGGDSQLECRPLWLHRVPAWRIEEKSSLKWNLMV